VQLKEENYCIKCNAMHCNAAAGGKKKKTKLTSMNKKMHSGCSSSSCSGLVDTRAISTATKGFVTRGVFSQEEEEEEEEEDDEEETQIRVPLFPFLRSPIKQSPGLKLSLKREQPQKNPKNSESSQRGKKTKAKNPNTPPLQTKLLQKPNNGRQPQ
jgi:hypothetical protein